MSDDFDYQRRVERVELTTDRLLIILYLTLGTAFWFVLFIIGLIPIKLLLIHPHWDDLANALPRPHEWQWATAAGLVCSLAMLIRAFPSFDRNRSANLQARLQPYKSSALLIAIGIFAVSAYASLQADGFW